MQILITTNIINNIPDGSLKPVGIDYYKLILDNGQEAARFNCLIDIDKAEIFPTENADAKINEYLKAGDLEGLKYKEFPESDFRAYLSICLKDKYKNYYSASVQQDEMFLFSVLDPAEIKDEATRLFLLDFLISAILNGDDSRPVTLLLHRNDWANLDHLQSVVSATRQHTVYYFSHEPYDWYYRIVLERLMKGELAAAYRNVAVVPKIELGIRLREKMLWGMECGSELAELNTTIAGDGGLMTEDIRKWVSAHYNSEN